MFITRYSIIYIKLGIFRLSLGNYYGLGHLREQELLKACSILGVTSVHVINDKLVCVLAICYSLIKSLSIRELQDAPFVSWSTTCVSKYIVHFIKTHKIQRVIQLADINSIAIVCVCVGCVI